MPRTAVSDADYLEKLQDYFAEHQVLPSYAAIGKLIGLKSTSSVSAFLDRLKAEGFVETTARRLKPCSRFFERPLMQSRVAAGSPSAACSQSAIATITPSRNTSSPRPLVPLINDMRGAVGALSLLISRRAAYM